jgi:hypothetical protein
MTESLVNPYINVSLLGIRQSKMLNLGALKLNLINGLMYLMPKLLPWPVKLPGVIRHTIGK